MKRKPFIVTVSLIMTSLVFVLLDYKPSIAQTVNLNYANFPPASTFPCVQMERWKTEVEKRTNGRVKINTFPGGTLLNAKNMINGVISGVADIGCLCMAYQPGRFIVTNATGLPLGLSNARIGSLVLWEIYKKYKPKAFSKVKVLTMFNTAPSNIMSKKPIRTLQDLKGYELRASGNAAIALGLWGGAAVGMPMSQTPEALQKGTVQGLFTALEVMKDFKFAEYLKYVTRTDTLMYPFAVVMNKNAWNKLPKDVQKVFDNLSAEQSEWTGNYMDKHVEEAIQWSKENHNLEIIQLPKEEKENWDRILEPMITDWIEEAKEKELPGEAIIKDIKAFSTQFK
ncbi:TRAP transporter substrate-binding protein [Desulfobacula sp.]|uniref:TRAP transporter substrate-binding protein n=1 Tax=Desulfobacula sp. TaxID=2593537 RepID=UPI002613CAE6|nr:TRAP transporter substrate-binding protein [Desulfobacula sp.]